MATTTFPRGRGLRRNRWLIGGVAVIVLGIIAAILISRSGQQAASGPATSTVTRGPIVASVSGSGSISAEQTLELPFQTSGSVTELLVNEGDAVSAGQVLARLDDRALRSRVATAEANLASARAEFAQAQQGSATPEDLASSQAGVANAEAQLAQARTGNVTAGDIAQAEAQLRSAQARLDDLLDSPKPDELSSAQRSLAEAQAEVERLRAGLQETRDSLSIAKSNAEIQLRQATIDLETAQSEYSEAYWRYQNVRDKGREPAENAGQSNPELSDYGNLSEQEAFKQAELKLQTAQENVRLAEVDLEDARMAESTGIAQAEQQLASAEAQLRDAETQLRVTEEGARPAEIAEAQASVDEARANLQKLTEGGTPEEVAAAQANVAQAQAELEKLTAPVAATDLEIRQASVAVAEQDLAQAQLDLEQATLRAPFAGIVSSIDIVTGSIVSANSAVLTLVDRSPLHVDLTLSENDVAQVALGQQVDLSLDALPGSQASGTVTYIAPSGDENNGVVTYKVRVSFPDDPQVKVGMSANLKITTAEKEAVLLVPNSALLPAGSGKAVQQPNADGSVREVPVSTGLSDGVSTEIISGLNEGDRVVTTPDVSTEQPGGLFGG
jgi:HlyD family secretion protein